MWQKATDDSWALHREHIRAGRCIVLCGPDPATVYQPATWPEIDKALRGELAYVEQHLHKHPDYCILNLCRLVYSYETRQVVVSKATASDWACLVLPEWRPLIEAAKKSYAHGANPQERQFMLADAPNLFAFARQRIELLSPN
jgi:hypothetical protein